MTQPPPGAAARGWVSLYATAFGLLILAGVALVSSAIGFLESTRLLWVSIGLSGLAIVTAVASLILPSR